MTPPPIAAWSLTTGEAGLRQQANGLAAALDPDFRETQVAVRRLWAAVPAALPLEWGVRAKQGRIAPPWPDVLVSCGRRGALVAEALNRRAGGAMVLAHIQPPPRLDPFDLVVSLPHDACVGRNVVCVETALHGIRPADLAAARAIGHPAFRGLPKPWTGVLVGGSTTRRPFTYAQVQQLCLRLDALRSREGGSLLVVTSRRTPPVVLAALGAHYGGDLTARVMDPQPPNPYLAVLAQTDRLVVTGDSISMVSEALSTGRPVQVFDELDLGPRHRAFVEALYARGRAAPLAKPGFMGDGRRLDPTLEVATRVRELVAARRAAPDS
ncbi:MAG: mitochondrial fission ELM1 family protein, partial [Proteobacteria bacterium]|nr:mitochondrial fission ELM1 family protein [Pseudomonadota bacterium]